MKRFLVMTGAVLGTTWGVTGVAGAAPIGLPIPPSVLKEVAEGRSASTDPKLASEARIAALKDKALNATDSAESMAAVRELKGMANVARPTLVSVLKTLLTRDQDAVQSASAGIGDGKEAAEFETKIDALRAEARANVPKLDKAAPETIKKAHEYYDQLVPMTAKMNQAWALRLTIVDAMGRRPALIGIWREVAPATDKSFPTDAETTLKKVAVKAVGDFVDKASGLTWNRAPSDESLKPLWFFGVSRRIEAWNNQNAPKFMDAEELKNLTMVNQYREAIGLLPYEADPRLVQSARRHSKEMVDKKFFSHESPTPENKDFGMRTQNAGYRGGSGENIAFGGGGGEKTFWMWFDSPGHHKNMAGGANAIGVGRWHDHYTQNFGAGPRVMLINEEERARVKVEGQVLAPDGGTGSGGVGGRANR